MRRFLVDTNVIIDILSRDPRWYKWSAETLQESADLGPLAINPIIFAELGVGAAPGRGRCPTSTSARTLRWRSSS